MTNLPTISGPCCACGEEKIGMRNLIYLPLVSMSPGKGWGCVPCGLPRNGAIAVICDRCFGSGHPVRWACSGWVVEPGRVPVLELVGEFIHDLAKHPELGQRE